MEKKIPYEIKRAIENLAKMGIKTKIRVSGDKYYILLDMKSTIDYIKRELSSRIGVPHCILSRGNQLLIIATRTRVPEECLELFKT